MSKSATALAIFALVGTGILAMPYISQVEAGQPAALAKGDRLDIRADCSEQAWPNLTSSCLKGHHNGDPVRLVR
jgi:hypothetical protein